MDRQSTDTIRRLCEKSDLRKSAELLFHSIKAKTRRGSGFELGQRTIAIPAICSLLASEELGYSDVNEKLAQASSCLHPKEFATALATVRAALSAAKKEKSSFKITYEGLIKAGKHSQGDFMVGCMEDVESALTLSANLRRTLRPPNDAVTVTIYCWTCKILKLKRQYAEIVKRYGVDDDDYQEIIDALDGTCQNVAEDIERRVRELRARKKTGTAIEGTPSPSKTKSKSTSPSKPSLRETASAQSRSPSKTPYKRKVTFSPVKGFDADFNNGVEDTPSKRQKFSSPVKDNRSPAFTAFQRALHGQSSMTSAGSTPSSSRLTLDLLQGGASENEISHGVTTEEDMEENDVQLPPPSDASSSDVDSVIPDAQMSDVSTRSSIEPTTPRRSQRQAKPRFPSQVTETPSTSSVQGTPRKRDKGTHALDEDAADTPRRRRRPVLLEHRQWAQRDPRIEREQKLREQWVKEMIQKRGSHPFESLRAGIATS